MADTPETLVAKQAITETLHEYWCVVDRIDPALGAEVWHHGGVAHDGPTIFEGTAEDFLKQVLELHRQAKGTSHQLTNIIISVNGDRATTECYVHVVHPDGGRQRRHRPRATATSGHLVLPERGMADR